MTDLSNFLPLRAFAVKKCKAFSNISGLPRRIRLLAMTALIVSVFFCLFLPCIGNAENNQDWPNDRTRLEQMSPSDRSDERCQTTWDILWSWAKRDNLEARTRLFMLSLFVPQNMVMRFPGRSGDDISRLRDNIILAVHSTGNDYWKHYDDFVGGLYADLGFTRCDIFSCNKFAKCLTDKPSPHCSHVAVEEKLVPSFDDYAAEIDLFLAQGLKPRCFFPPPNAKFND